MPQVRPPACVSPTEATYAKFILQGFGEHLSAVLKQLRPECLQTGLHPSTDGRIIQGIGDIVCSTRHPVIPGHFQIDHQVLGDFPLPVINADHSFHNEAFDQYSVCQGYSGVLPLFGD